MAQLVGGITTSHVPAIGRAIAKNLQHDPYWKPFFDGFAPVHRWLDSAKPDVLVVFYNDHGLNFFLDKMPTFSVGAAPWTSMPPIPSGRDLWPPSIRTGSISTSAAADWTIPPWTVRACN